jgi:hypothetical protein
MLLPSSIHFQTSEAASQIIVPRDYPTIQAAINAASPGDTIKVLPGTYREQITISKSLTLIGTGDRNTIIKAPAILPDTNPDGNPYIVIVDNEAEVKMKGLTVSGPSGVSCPDLIGINIMLGASLNLDFAAIKDCTQNGILAEGDATVTRTNVNDYRDHGIFGFGEGSTIRVSHNSINAAQDSEIAGQIGVLLVFGAKGIIDHNKISNNLCALPECGPDYLTQTQAFGIVTFLAASGSSITNNIISNNDAGIDVIGESGCCIVDRNIITNSAQNDLLFGVVVQDGEHTISNTKITGRNVVVGVLAVAFDTDTVATLDRVIIKGATTPTQELPVGATAEVIFVPRSSHTMQSTISTLTENPISFSLPTPGFVNLGS